MQQIQTFDFGGYWERFVAVLESPCQATRAPFLAPSLPANFVKRPAQSGQIIQGILDKDRKNPTGNNVVLYGAGGFGKTTLVLDVCHNEDVFAAFDGGILWVTLGEALGEKHSTIPELTKIYDALTDERPNFANPDDAMISVSQKLAGKRCLLVIDDVWEERDLKSLPRAGDQTSRVITTRRFDIAVSLAEPTNRINVAELTPNEAEQCLTARLEFPASLLPRFRELANRLGEWPLLLQLANRAMLEQVARGDTVEGALDFINDLYRQRGVTGFDRENAQEREEAIGKTVDLSLSLLKGDRESCLQLAIFPEDTVIPIEVIGVLWQKDALTTRKLAQRMHDLALIRLDLLRTSGAVQTSGVVRLHDAMRKFFASQLPNSALLHGRLADAWRDPTRLRGGYAQQYVAYHLAEAMADPIQAAERGQQLINLLTDPSYGVYRDHHADPLALHGQLLLALKHAARNVGSSAPALVPALALLVKSFAQSKHNPELFFGAATAGLVREAELRLDVFDADVEWKTLARLLIAWIAADKQPSESKAATEAAAAFCDKPELRSVLAWARVAPDGVPSGLPPITDAPMLLQIEAILQRAAGAEMKEGVQPVNRGLLVSGLSSDASAFIADQDGPLLVAFAKVNPAANTEYLDRYIDIHAANRYRYYRNRSLWALLKYVLSYPEVQWVRRLLEKIVKAAFTPTEMEFEESLTLAVWGVQARQGDESASKKLDNFNSRLYLQVTGNPPGQWAPKSDLNDSWAHYQRCACALAETYALALNKVPEAESLLELARQLPKGFAGYRSFSALTLAESIQLATPTATSDIEAALQSAQAAGHRIQDYPFCLRTTAMVNAIRSRWSSTPPNLEQVVVEFSENPFAERFCALHRVLEDFSFRYSDYRFQSLPIPESVLKAQTLDEIANAYRMQSKDLARINAGIDPAEKLNKNVEIAIPDPDFAPILAARLAAAALSSSELSSDRRITLIQTLAPVAVPNRTALSTVLSRLLLSARESSFQMPSVLASLSLPPDPEPATSSEAGIG